MAELVQPILILEDAAEDTLIVAEEQEGCEAAICDGEAQRPPTAVPRTHAWSVFGILMECCMPTGRSLEQDAENQFSVKGGNRHRYSQKNLCPHN